MNYNKYVEKLLNIMICIVTNTIQKTNKTKLINTISLRVKTEPFCLQNILYRSSTIYVTATVSTYRTDGKIHWENRRQSWLADTYGVLSICARRGSRGF